LGHRGNLHTRKAQCRHCNSRPTQQKRKTLPTEWLIYRKLSNKCSKGWFVPIIDLIATIVDTKFKLLVLPVPDELAIETDAIQMNL